MSNMAELMDELEVCDRCTAMVKSRSELRGEGAPPIFPNGNEHAAVVIVGIAPGHSKVDAKYERERQIKRRESFGYREGAGGLLDKCLISVGLTRADVWITNICHCNVRSPRLISDRDAETCVVNFLSKELALVNPRKIIVLGMDAKLRFTKHLKEWEKRARVYYLTHPAFFLHAPFADVNAYVERWIAIFESDDTARIEDFAAAKEKEQ